MQRHADVLGVTAVALRAQHVVARALVVAAFETGLAAATRQARLHHDSPAGHEFRVGRLDDFAGDVGPENVGQPQADDAAPVPDVEVIERARADAHERVAGPGFGVERVFVPEHLRPTVLVEADCLHDALRTMGAPRSSSTSVGAILS